MTWPEPDDERSNKPGDGFDDLDAPSWPLATRRGRGAADARADRRDRPAARARARPAAADGHQTSLALAGHAAALKLAELPDALVLRDLGSPVQTIALLRALRGGEMQAARTVR